MRTVTLLVAVGILAVFGAPALAFPGLAQAPTPRLSVVVHGLTSDGAFVFDPDEIVIPQVPIVLNVTFTNMEASGIQHTWSIGSAGRDEAEVISSGFLDPGENWTVEFTINAMDNITIGTRSFAPEEGVRGVRYYCVPHRIGDAGMVGEIVLASAAGPAGEPAEKGINIRAYWIGMIGIVAMIGWVGVTYFVIKSSSPRFKDHRGHVRKGLP